MIEHNYVLKNDQPYIELNKLLKFLGIAQTGGHAKILIQNGEVLVNGTIETRVRKKLIKLDEVLVNDQLIKIQ